MMNPDDRQLLKIDIMRSKLRTSGKSIDVAAAQLDELVKKYIEISEALQGLNGLNDLDLIELEKTFTRLTNIGIIKEQPSAPTNTPEHSPIQHQTTPDVCDNSEMWDRIGRARLELEKTNSN